MTPARIAHIDTAASPDAVDGVASNLWLLCSEQARRGLDVTLFSRTRTDDRVRRAAHAAGFAIIDTPHAPSSINPRAVSRALSSCRPDLVHFHGSWQPHHGVAGHLVRRAAIPYVYAPYGGLAPVVLASRPHPRRLYMALLETPLGRGAAGLAPSFRTELDDIAAAFGTPITVPWRVLSPPVPPEVLHHAQPLVARRTERVIYLGRYDIFQKGLDRIVELARAVPEVTFQLHGSASPDELADLRALQSQAPDNVVFGDPVFGDDKWKALGEAAAYIQLSRFEGFPTAVAEALCSGLPAIVSRDLGIAAEIVAADVGLVLDPAASDAADRLRAFLSDHDARGAAGARAARFGRDTFAVGSIVDHQLELYAEVLGRELSFGPDASGRPAASAPETASRAS